MKIMIVLLLAAIAADRAMAEGNARMLDDNPGYCNIFYHLNGGDVPENCPKKRGIRVPPTPVAFSKMITFAFDSATILPQSADVLNNILAVIQHEKMAGKTIRVNGHTDIVGSPEYNQRLSEQRALAVKHYFVGRGVAGQRIQTAGFGFSQLHDPDHPADGINRRVEFVNLGE